MDLGKKQQALTLKTGKRLTLGRLVEWLRMLICPSQGRFLANFNWIPPIPIEADLWDEDATKQRTVKKEALLTRRRGGIQ